MILSHNVWIEHGGKKTQIDFVVYVTDKDYKVGQVFSLIVAVCFAL